jgi:uncharacterized repeat protein (TIGR03837 family)
MPATPHPLPAPHNTPLLWDLFCRVVDNFGDIGVCWRLAADLAARGHSVRLWVDNASALPWMAPGAMQGQWPGVQVLPWEASQNHTLLATLPQADVWVEAFGCELAPELIAASAHSTRASGNNGNKFPVWINLEYLSAEGYVERCHGLPSPVMHGPAQGRTKHFFYPGFTSSTGGLLRESDLAQRRDAFDQPGQRAAWLAQQGIPWQGECLVSLFCYEPTALPGLLLGLATGAEPTRVLVATGRATTAVQSAITRLNSLQPTWNVRKALSISYLPTLTQRDFDHLLWACDLNYVRGEDSVVRAIWAGNPLVWQIYPQDDSAHHGKLDAFLDMLHAPPSLRQYHRLWNSDAAWDGTVGPSPLTHLKQWAQTVCAARERLMEMDDLATQLCAFVQKKR